VGELQTWPWRGWAFLGSTVATKVCFQPQGCISSRRQQSFSNIAIISPSRPPRRSLMTRRVVIIKRAGKKSWTPSLVVAYGDLADYITVPRGRVKRMGTRSWNINSAAYF